jgi:hypothetical protein
MTIEINKKVVRKVFKSTYGRIVVDWSSFPRPRVTAESIVGLLCVNK